MIVLGHAFAATDRRAACDQYSQYIITALAWLVEAREPLPCAVQQLCRIRARAESRDQEERHRLDRMTSANGVFLARSSWMGSVASRDGTAKLSNLGTVL
jgi:hypothetical protein